MTDFLGGGENIRSKDFMTIHAMPEIFLSTMVLDGIFEQFPRLRGGCIEQGAMWIVPWLRRLDISQETFVKSEKYLSLPLKASDYVRRNLRFTPFPHEPVGWIVEQAGPELCMFSSDYPHIEGGRNPLKRFELSTPNLSEAAREKFYATQLCGHDGIARGLIVLARESKRNVCLYPQKAKIQFPLGPVGEDHPDYGVPNTIAALLLEFSKATMALMICSPKASRIQWTPWKTLHCSG